MARKNKAVDRPFLTRASAGGVELCRVTFGDTGPIFDVEGVYPTEQEAVRQIERALVTVPMAGDDDEDDGGELIDKQNASFDEDMTLK